METHRISYTCHFCQGKAFQLEEHYLAHIRKKHATVLDDSEEQTMLDIARKPLSQLMAHECPCCSDWVSRLRERMPAAEPDSQDLDDTVYVAPTVFKRHLASHLEQIALFAIPIGSSEEDANSMAAIEESQSALSVKSDISSLVFGSPTHSLTSESAKTAVGVEEEDVSMQIRAENQDESLIGSPQEISSKIAGPAYKNYEADKASDVGSIFSMKGPEPSLPTDQQILGSSGGYDDPLRYDNADQHNKSEGWGESDSTPYPFFLQQDSSAYSASKWENLEWARLQRSRDSMSTDGEDKPHPWACCSGHAYTARNRYSNAYPYQANRVRLDVPDGCFDYINASHIKLVTTRSKTSLHYIATQGPKADCWSHFWRMLWHEVSSPADIIMLTKHRHQAQEMSFQYYPRSLKQPDLRVNRDDEFKDNYIHDLHLVRFTHNISLRTGIREIDMTTVDGIESRKIWHLLFAGWPELSIPEGADKTALLELIRYSRHNNTTQPRIVYCNNGVGRTGTFVALDWLMQELREGALDYTPDDQDPVSYIVQELRDQRPMMVQSKEQFLFLYDVLREQWRKRWLRLH